MKLRKSTQADVETIMSIIGDAQELLASQGSDQWQDGYPNTTQIETDIQKNESYVVVDDNGNIMATTMFTFGGEVTYNSIEGEWITKDPVQYGVIHRLAVSAQHRKKGLAKFVLIECEEMLKERKFDSLRIDTHRMNTGMQHMLLSNGYVYCGVIQLARGSDRLAYEKKM